MVRVPERLTLWRTRLASGYGTRARQSLSSRRTLTESTTCYSGGARPNNIARRLSLRSLTDPHSVMKLGARAIIAPVYPRGLALPHETLFERADFLERQGQQRFLRDFRLIHEAIAAQDTTAGPRPYYFEMSVHGIAFMEQVMTPAGRAGDYDFVYLGNLLHPVASALNLAIALLRGAVANLLIRYELIHCTQLSLLLRDYSRFVMPQQAAPSRIIGCPPRASPRHVRGHPSSVFRLRPAGSLIRRARGPSCLPPSCTDARSPAIRCARLRAGRRA